MKVWADFHTRVMPYVLGCPSPTVDAALIDSAREFCQRTKCWTQNEPAYVFTGEARGEFDIPSGTDLLQVKRVTVNGKDYKVKDAADLPEDWATNPPNDNTLYQVSQLEYLIFPMPSAADAISMTLVLQPTYSGEGVDDETHDLYAEAIAAGARARLQRMPRQDWTDISQAAIDGAYFTSQVHYAANRDFMRAKHHRVTKVWP